MGCAMKTLVKNLAPRAVASAVAVALLSPTVVQAEKTTWFGEEASGTWMAGLKYGRQANGNEGYGEATASTIMLGYMFDRPVYRDGSAALELEFTNTVDNGDITDPAGNPNGVWANDSTSLFFAYRTPGTVYFKAKAGVTVADRYVSRPSHPRFHDQELDLIWGAGLGVHLGERANLEVEYTVPLGVNNQESLGANDTTYLTGGFNLNF